MLSLILGFFVGLLVPRWMVAAAFIVSLNVSQFVDSADDKTANLLLTSIAYCSYTAGVSSLLML